MESEFSSGTNLGNDSNEPGAKGAALLLVIGEPNTEDHKNVILEEITKAFKYWSSENVDINDELARIANHAASGEEGPNAPYPPGPHQDGARERVIRHRSERMAAEILVNPQLQTLTAALKNFFSIDMPYKHLIFAGHYMEGSGAWVLQDDIFSVSKLVSILNDLKTNIQSEKFCVHCHQEGEWRQVNLLKIAGLKEHGFAVSPTETQTNHHGIIQFVAYVSNFVKAMTLTDLMKSTDLVGSLKFTKPTMYIFPGCEGDSALFAMREFNLLVNGGFRRKSCFWDFARHLERVDAMLITHLGIDNLFGLSSLLHRKSLGQVQSDIGYVYMNATDKSASLNGFKHSSLKINIAEEGTEIVEACKKIGLTPHPCTRGNTSQPLAPVNLYHKVGHGTLDMYVLNPVADSKELKEFLQQWQKNGADFGLSQGMPLPNLVSICALLVWKPANPNEKINRILFPGNAPQHKIAEGLEKLKHLDFLKYPSCSAKDLSSKGATKKSASAKPPSGKPAAGRLSLDTGKHASKPVNDNSKTAPSRSLNGHNKPSKSAEQKAPPKSISDSMVSRKAEPTKTDKKDTHAQRSKSDLNKSVDKHKSKPAGAEGKESPRHTTPKPSKVDAKKTSKPAEEKPSTKSTSSKSSPIKEAKPIAESTPKKASPTKETKQSKETSKCASEAVVPAPVIPPQPDIAPEPQVLAEPEIAQEPVQKDLELDMSAPVPSQPEQQPNTGSLLDFDQFSSTPQENDVSGAPVQQQNFMDDPFAMGQSQQDPFSMGQPQQDPFAMGQSQQDPFTMGQSQHDSVPDDQDLIQPASLPDPVAYSPQEPDVIPESFPKDMSGSFIQPETDLIGEPDVVPPIQADKPVLDDFVSGVSSPDTQLKESPVEDPLGELKESPTEEQLVEKCPEEDLTEISNPDTQLKESPVEDPLGELKESPTEEQLVEKCPEEDLTEISNPDTQLKESPVEDPLGELKESPTEEQLVEKCPEEDLTEIYNPDTQLKESPVEDPLVELKENPMEEQLVEESPEEDLEEMQPSENKLGENDTTIDPTEIERLTERETKSPVEPAATTMDALDEVVAEVEDGEESPDEVDSQGDSAEITADPDSQGSQEEIKDGDIEENVSPFAFENQGFTDLSQNQDEGVQEMSEQTNSPEEEKSDDVQEVAEEEVEEEPEMKEESHVGPHEVAGQDQVCTEPAEIIFDDGFHESENNIQREINYQGNGAPLDSIREEEDIGHGNKTDQKEGLNPFNGLDQAQINQPMQDQNPFASDDPFHGQLSMGYQPSKEPVNLRQIPCQEGYEFDPDGEEEARPDSDEEIVGNQEEQFNPEAEWGRPMGLPSPPPPEEKKESNASKNEKVANGKGQVNGKQAKPTNSSKEPTKSSSTTTTRKEKSSVSKSTASSTSKTVTEKKGGLNTSRLETSRTERLNTSRLETSSTTRARPASAAVGEPKTKSAPRRPATATGTTRASPTATKMPAMPAMHSYYMDLAYIPNHGNPATCDVEFFKRVRAKYYVYSSMNPNTHTLNALLDAKATWQEPDLQVTLIPTYDTDVLRQWMVEKQEKLAELKVEVAPSASRCTVQLQEHETCCLAYRLELSNQA